MGRETNRGEIVMFKKILIIFSILPLLLAACAPAAAPEQTDETGIGERSLAEGAPAPMEAPAADMAAGYEGEQATAADRIVIKNGHLEIVVEKPEESLDRISQLAEEFGGYVVNANLYQSYLENGQEVPRATITIRVLADKMDEAMARIEAESDRLPQSKTIDSQDVTSEYTDLESRLRNLEAAEAQLVEIMDNANRTEDVLAVYNQLTQVREQIEVIKGQMKYYEESARLSSISVELIANQAVQPITSGGWEPVGVIKDAIQALINGMQVIFNIAAYLILTVLPILLVIALPIYLIVLGVSRWRRRRKNKRLSDKPEDPTEIKS
jgi:hypothetical protein